MTTLEVQLTTILRDIAELSVSVGNREHTIQDLQERASQKEIKIRILERQLEGG